MSLPNYSPSGKILFGSVPWDNGYTNVRLYQDTGTQYNDIVSRMTVSSDNYTYIGRNRRIKVSIEADRLYHCNYCMYRNDSLTDGYIYCFITDVKYINDNTSEIAIETDVFQTYLYSVDWTIPPCFIERETTPSEDDKYLLTSEPDFSMTFSITEMARTLFKPKGVVVVTSAKAVENESVTSLFEGHWTTEGAKCSIVKGVFRGAGYYYIPYIGSITESFEQFFNGLMYAGSTDSIAAVFTIPDFFSDLSSEGWVTGASDPDSTSEVQAILNVPQLGTTVDGYTPHNKKLLYYPYTRVRLTDQNGSFSELKYELMGNRSLNIKYAPSPVCQALVYPDNYMGMNHNLESGITVSCGTWCSWSNNAYQNWLAQNSANIALTVAGIALAEYTGPVNIASAFSHLKTGAGELKAGVTLGNDILKEAAGNEFKRGARQLRFGLSDSAGAGSGAAAFGAQLVSSSKAPTTTRGQLNSDPMVMTGTQGVWAERVQVKAEIAQQIDQFFDCFGYAVERIDQVNITSRPSWNYVKTQGAAPKSTNMAAGTSAPFSRGRGTPADALSIIRQAFDSGVTFWHTTGNFGNYQLSNSL